MQKWEYRIIANQTEVDLNKLGAAGWEVVSVTFDSGGGPRFFYFKRPKA